MRGRVLKATVRKNGYKMVDLTAPGGRRESLYVHHLVLLVFEGPRPEWAEEIRHFNNVKTDCEIWNIEYGTRKQNAEDRERHGIQLHGSQSYNAKLTEDGVRWARSMKGIITQNRMAEELGCSQSAIQLALTRKQWAHV